MYISFRQRVPKISRKVAEQVLRVLMSVVYAGERSGAPDTVRVTSDGTSGLQSERPGLGRGFVSPGSTSNPQLVRASGLSAALERARQHQVCRHWLGTNEG